MDAYESALRSLQAAAEHVRLGDFKTAGALLRCAGRYVERMNAGGGHQTGEVVQLPPPTRLRAQGSRVILH